MFTLALGRSFEAYNIAALRILQEHEGLNVDSFICSKVFPDPNGIINPKNKEFEVDIFCESPLVIGEVTTSLLENEMEKVTKFVKIVNLLEQIHGKERGSLAYFFAFEIHPNIKDAVVTILKDSNIKLICPDI